MKKLSTQAKPILVVTLFMLVTNLALGFVLMQQSRAAMKQLIDERMLDIVNTAAEMLDGDVLDRLTAADKGTPEYESVRDTLDRYHHNTSLKYIYYVRDEGNNKFTFGIDADPVAPAEFGASVVYTDALYQSSQGTSAVDEKPYEDVWGRFYSAYSPVFDSSGKVAAVVVVDFEAAWYEAQLNQNAKTIAIGCMLFLVIGVGLALLLARQFGVRMSQINRDLYDLASDMAELTGSTGNQPATRDRARTSDVGIEQMEATISRLRDDLRQHVTHLNTQANSMITAMASDYRSVFHVDLDKDEATCYRADPHDPEHVEEGVQFAFCAWFRAYGEQNVAQSYREGFLRFIEPDNIREALETQPIISYRYLVAREGREYYEMIRAAGVRRAEDRDDHIVHAVGIGFTEIDAEMRETMAKNQKLAEALEMAEEANRAKTDFLSNMSHEIRTPMNAIIGLDTLALHNDNLDEQTRDYLERIGESARHLLGLINDILDMSRIESGRIVLRKEEFSFSAMLEQINTMVMSQCEDKGLDYECSMLSRVDNYYIGDDTRLKEVLINILSNAVKFTDAPGNIRLTVEQTAVFEDQSTLRFCISDTGIGMDEEFIPRIFDAFSQEDSSRKNKYGSTGLGMAITKNIVEMMNGTIDVKSQKGVGSEFTVTVTLKNCERNDDSGENSMDLSQIRVLIVDDEEFAAEHARVTLNDVGIQADTCGGGEEALHMLEIQHTKLEPYNLVLMDRKMPEMDGLEATRRIREEFSSSTTVVLLTAYTWDDIREEALEAGVDGFLSKPLFASSVLAEFERDARRNNLSLFTEKKLADLDGRRILLAEDYEVNAEIMMDVLEMEGMEADHAINGRVVVEMFEQSEPGTYSAILMDVRMPEMDGLEATEAIRALNRPDAKTIPIIALTANAFDEDVQRSLQAGMNAHLSKPVDLDHLFQTLGELIYEAEG